MFPPPKKKEVPTQKVPFTTQNNMSVPKTTPRSTNALASSYAKLHEPPAGRDEQVFSIRWAERSNTCNPRLQICSKTLIPPFLQGLDSHIAPRQHSFFPQMSRLMCFSHQNCTLPFRTEHLADVARRGLFSSICSRGNLNVVESTTCLVDSTPIPVSPTRQHFSPVRQHFRNCCRVAVEI